MKEKHLCVYSSSTDELLLLYKGMIWSFKFNSNYNGKINLLALGFEAETPGFFCIIKDW